MISIMPLFYRGRHALTLIEVMVAISVVAVLLAIIAPSVSRSVEASRRTVSLANVASGTRSIELFTSSSTARYPSLEAGQWFQQGTSLTYSIALSVWDIGSLWPYVTDDTASFERGSVYLAPSAVRRATVVLLPDGLPDERVASGPPSYFYSQTLVSASEAWVPGALVNDSMKRPQRTDQVVYPSNKAILWEWELPYVRRPLKYSTEGDLDEIVPVGFADGHAALKVPAAAGPAIRNPFADSRSYRNEKLANTIDGVRGRDY